MIKIKQHYYLHLISFAISAVLLILSTSHLLFTDLTLMPEYRDIVSPANKDNLVRAPHLFVDTRRVQFGV